jgi:hypothetical protein
MRHEWNFSNIFDTQLAWLDHEAAAIKGCFSNWCVRYGLPAANASGFGKGPWSSELGQARIRR